MDIKATTFKSYLTSHMKLDSFVSLSLVANVLPDSEVPDQHPLYTIGGYIKQVGDDFLLFSESDSAGKISAIPFTAIALVEFEFERPCESDELD